MNGFYETCKLLIDTEVAYKDGAPHVTVTGINSYTQECAVEVEFDYEEVFAREDKYHDVVGFYHTHPAGLDCMSGTDIETMKQWVNCLGKSLLCIIETEENISGWVFSKNDNGEVEYKDTCVRTHNDVNYDVWLKKDGNFWNPVSFLFEEDFSEEDKYFTEFSKKIDALAEKQENLTKTIGYLADVLGKLCHH